MIGSDHLTAFYGTQSVAAPEQERPARGGPQPAQLDNLNKALTTAAGDVLGRQLRAHLCLTPHVDHLYGEVIASGAAERCDQYCLHGACTAFSTTHAQGQLHDASGPVLSRQVNLRMTACTNLNLEQKVHDGYAELAGQRTMAIMELSSLLDQMKQIEAQEANLLSVASDQRAQVSFQLSPICPCRGYGGAVRSKQCNLHTLNNNLTVSKPMGPPWICSVGMPRMQ